MDKFDINNVRVNRTTEGTIFEVISALIIILSWLIAALTFGIHWPLAIPAVLMSVCSVCLLGCTYFPKTINTRLEYTNIRQVELVIRATRVIAVELALMASYILIFCYFFPKPPNHLPAIILLVTVLIFRFLIRRAK